MPRRDGSGTGRYASPRVPKLTPNLGMAPHLGMALALALFAAGFTTGGDAWAAGGGQDTKAEAAPAEGGDLVPLDPLYAPMVPPDRGGRPQAALTMQLVVGPEGSVQKIRALMPRLRDALIRDFFAYPITQTGEFPGDMLPTVTKRVMNIATRVYGDNVVSGVLFSQILKIGC